MLTVKVISAQSGEPVKDAKVDIIDDGFYSRGVSNAESTDSDGEAHFDIDIVSGKVFVNGSNVYAGHLSGRIVVYINMGDTYNIGGQVGAVGANAHAHDNTFNQIVSQLEKSIDLSDLAKQLTELRQAITAKQDGSPQAAIAVGEVAKAEIAAKEKNPSKVVESLKTAGQWTLDFAKDIGKDIVVEAIKQSMGLP